MNAYSIALRQRVLSDFDSGMGNNAVARKYRVSSRWVYSLRRQRADIMHLHVVTPEFETTLAE